MSISPTVCASTRGRRRNSRAGEEERRASTGRLDADPTIALYADATEVTVAPDADAGRTMAVTADAVGFYGGGAVIDPEHRWFGCERIS